MYKKGVCYLTFQTKEEDNMKKSVLLAALIVGFASLFVISCAQKELTADKAEFIVNNAAEPQTLDPSLIQGVPEHRLYMALFEGLTINDPKTPRLFPVLPNPGPSVPTENCYL
jgi:oligopeptide transport system substrate-binding protein